MINAGKQGGFSLLELLVVMVIMGLVVTAIYSLHQTSQRSASTQDEVVEVQQNLRVAMDQITRDVRMAGFLIATDEAPLSTATASTLTIRTASALGHAARITASFTSTTDTDSVQQISVALAEETDLFEAGQYVRIVRPATEEQPLDRVLIVTGKDRTVPCVRVRNFSSAEVFKQGDMIVRVLDAGTDDSDPNTNAPAHPNTISYALVDDPDSSDSSMKLLQRTATGLSAETVAMKVTGLQFSYLIADGTETSSPTASQRDDIRAVRITLSGATDATKTGRAYYSGVKNRSVSSVVRLRNNRNIL
jgi:prepilin-type N-terminal cleavage/methylation domain-containing protein